MRQKFLFASFCIFSAAKNFYLPVFIFLVLPKIFIGQFLLFLRRRKTIELPLESFLSNFSGAVHCLHV